MKKILYIVLFLNLSFCFTVKPQGMAIKYDDEFDKKIKRQLEIQIQETATDINRTQDNIAKLKTSKGKAEALKLQLGASIKKHKQALEVLEDIDARNKISGEQKELEELHLQTIKIIEVRQDEIDKNQKQYEELIQLQSKLSQLREELNSQLKESERIKELVKTVNELSSTAEAVQNSENLSESDREENINRIFRASEKIATAIQFFNKREDNKIQALAIMTEIKQINTEISKLTTDINRIKDLQGTKHIKELKDLQRVKRLKNVAKAKLYLRYVKTASKATIIGLLFSLSGIDDLILDAIIDGIAEWYYK
jgi:DNA repair exonuclease SbcCD ATPase subunit